MNPISLHDKREIESYLRRDTFLHLYEIGDLDDFFWNYTTWYAFKEAQIDQLVLIYTGTALPVLLGLTTGATDTLHELLRAMLSILPKRLYCHLSGDAVAALADDYRVQSHGAHYKMGLTDSSRLNLFDTSSVIQLSTSDLPELEELYRESYPDNAFDARMLETGCYFGVRRGGELVSAAGIHVYSPHYKVAALGNVTTRPTYRGRGLGTTVCAKLCQYLLQTVDHIGLNVKADNAGAIACYKKLGFTHVANYEEYLLEAQ